MSDEMKPQPGARSLFDPLRHQKRQPYRTMDANSVVDHENVRIANSQIIRYLLVGGWNTIFSYCVFAFFTYILTGLVPYAYMLATVISSIINITVAYLGYKFFVFKTKGNYIREYLRCYAVYGAAVGLSLVLLPTLVALLTLVFGPDVYIPYIAGALVSLGTVFLSFFGHRSYSFRPPSEFRPGHTTPANTSEPSPRS